MKVGGLCYDKRTRKWKSCVESAAAASTGGLTEKCCVNENCCIDCDEINAIRICAATNIQLFTQTVEGELGNAPDGVRLVRQWRNMSWQPGGCNRFVPVSNSAPTELLKNDERVPCYFIDGYVNSPAVITPGQPKPIGIIFKSNDPTNCADFAVFFLMDVVPYREGYRWKLLASKYCLNYQDIVTETDFYSACRRCPAPQTCQVLARSLEPNQIGTNVQYDLGILDYYELTLTNFSIIIPECCNENLGNENFVVTKKGKFVIVNVNFVNAPLGPGAYNISIELLGAAGGGGDSTEIKFRTSNCGEATITLTYVIV